MSALFGLGQSLRAILGAQDRSGEDETRRKVRPGTRRRKKWQKSWKYLWRAITGSTNRSTTRHCLAWRICPSRPKPIGSGLRKNQRHNAFLDPLTFVESKDLVEKLALAVAALPERERMVVTFYYHEELTLREIGEILDLSEGRICQIFAQAVGRLRIALGIKPRENVSAKRTSEARKQSAKKPVRV